jgi:glycosyltransferase involved in cell wall biosynthesis
VPAVSVIVPVRDAEGYVAQALRSALAQPAADLEVLVADDGSTDGTLGAVRALGDDRVRVLTPAAGGARGPGAARNRAIAAASGDVLAFLDADDLWAPDKLAVQLAELERRPDLGALGGLLRYISADGAPLGVNAQDAAVDRARVAAGALMPFMLTSTVVPAPAAAEVGPFDEELPGSEDLDWLARLARLAPIDRLDRVVGSYRVHGGSTTMRQFLLQRQATRFVAARLAGEATAWPAYRDAPVPPAVARADRVAFHYRRAGLAVGERAWLRAARHGATAVGLDPRGTLRRVRAQVVGR